MPSPKFVSSSLLRQFLLTAGTTLFSFSAYAQAVAPTQGPGATRPANVARNPDQALNFAISNENRLDQKLRSMQPLIETYIQQLQPDESLGQIPKEDHYFLGRLDLSNGANQDSYTREPGFLSRTLESFTKAKGKSGSKFLARGFDQMVVMDDGGFDRTNYQFKYVRREFLGEVRCLVYDVIPTKEAGHGRFVGRIWIEDQAYNVVRFNGTYSGSSRATHYTHFDSWRVNCAPNVWLPSYIYTEETAMITGAGSHPLAFKAQVRLWGYQSNEQRKQQEFTNITVETPQGVNDKSEQAADNSPIEAIRSWQRQAEDNLLDRLTDGGMVAPVGEVDKVLQTVLDNLQITNNIATQPEMRVRVMMTTPMESVYIGHTIVISRGLLDVLPDEATLAAVIAHQLGHIVLGHQIDTAFSFSDRMFFNDDQTLQRFGLARPESEEDAADQKALEILKKSPYADQLPKVGLFLRMLAARGEALPHLISPLLGNGLMASSRDMRLAALMDKAPEVQMSKLEQVPALPLGARVKVNPWNNQLTLLKTRKVAALSSREKQPFEITPVYLHLTRYSEANATPDAANPGNQTPASQPTTTSQVRSPSNPKSN